MCIYPSDEYFCILKTDYIRLFIVVLTSLPDRISKFEMKYLKIEQLFFSKIRTRICVLCLTFVDSLKQKSYFV